MGVHGICYIIPGSMADDPPDLIIRNMAMRRQGNKSVPKVMWQVLGKVVLGEGRLDGNTKRMG